MDLLANFTLWFCSDSWWWDIYIHLDFSAFICSQLPHYRQLELRSFIVLFFSPFIWIASIVVLFNFSALRLSWTFVMIYNKAKLKCNGDATTTTSFFEVQLKIILPFVGRSERNVLHNRDHSNKTNRVFALLQKLRRMFPPWQLQRHRFPWVYHRSQCIGASWDTRLFRAVWKSPSRIPTMIALSPWSAPWISSLWVCKMAPVTSRLLTAAISTDTSGNKIIIYPPAPTAWPIK
jgi:hypothetical protein